MAIMSSILRNIKGSAGEVTFRVVNGQTVMSKKTTRAANTRTSAQQKQRVKWGNVVQTYKKVMPYVDKGFENKPKGVTDYNMFMKLNMQITDVYLTKQQVASSACVIDGYQITQGSLPSIKTTGMGANQVTDINLGTLTIDDTTTVAAFSQAVVSGNRHFDYGDQISFYEVTQEVNAVTNYPFVDCEASAVVLSKTSQTPLLTLVPKNAFLNVDGYLGHGDSTDDGAFCWVHSRYKNAKTTVSTQFLLPHNSLLETYTSQEAYDAAVASYGGVSDYFLTPTSTEEVTTSDKTDDDTKQEGNKGDNTGGTDQEGGSTDQGTGGSEQGGASSGSTGDGSLV